MAPVLVDSDQNVLQDSTAIIAAVEAAHPEPSVTPPEPALAALSAVLEDYADEWLSKAMFFYRWGREEDSAEAAKRVAELVFPEADAPDDVLASIRTRMGGRLHHVGATPDNAAIIEGSFARLLELLEAHFASRSFLFGGKPALADFALFAQLQQLAADPTPGAIIRANAPNTAAWIARMERPAASGDFETLDALKTTLLPLISAEIAGAYLPWMLANAGAVAGEGGHVSVSLAGGPFSQKPQRNAAKSFSDVQRFCAAHADDALRAFLDEAGASALLSATEEAEEEDEEGGED
jgi:glutathione S-transferase